MENLRNDPPKDPPKDPKKKPDNVEDYPYIITGTGIQRKELQESVGKPKHVPEKKSWKVKEVGEITPEVAALEDKLVKEEYNKWAADPESLKNTRLVFGPDAKILPYEKWISSQRMSQLKFEPENEGVEDAEEDQLPKNYLRVEYQSYYGEKKKINETPDSYFEWLKARERKLGTSEE
ncbi:hypothetical protein HOG17_00970 [Candidatus Peregrinibacteria bacterium]|jgi:hypothetical protein|nr:hypothetical protein [Candidatus Peregrinibacteria bacterium]MBT4148576.1 hypothetical protein [Candidatus Peregrinibacteria bacterium]MBT4456353.1 hypothetical protein [Candidatus Peregrinibacteria bacterium]